MTTYSLTDMRLTDTDIIKDEDIFNGFDIERMPKLESDRDKNPKYIILNIRLRGNKRIKKELCAYIDPFEEENSDIPPHAITAARLAEWHRMAKIGYGGIKKNKYDYFNHCANIYIYSLKGYIERGINGFNIEEWECVGGRCKVVDGKERIQKFLRHLVIKSIVKGIEDELIRGIYKAIGK